METTILPQFSDSDALGHINYLAANRWFEEARSPLYRLLFPTFFGNERFLVLVHMELDFSNETFLDQAVTIRTEVLDVGRTSLTIRQTARQGERLCITGKFVLVHFDLVARTSLPIDDELRRKILSFSNGEAIL